MELSHDGDTMHDQSNDPHGMPYVLVPGGWHGGWNFRPITDRLRARGETVCELTLSGVGERNHIPAGMVNLNTHIEDVVRVFEQEDLRDAVLCGHSYAGMVITGVADRICERIARIIYIDAYVPANGDSCFTLTTPAFQQAFLDGAQSDGWGVVPPTGLDPRATPHPIASFLQAISLSGRQNQVPRRHYVYLSRWNGTPFTSVYERLRHETQWQVHELPTGHNVMGSR